MLHFILKSKTKCMILIHRKIPFIQVKTLTYKTRMERLHNDGLDLKQQTVEIDSTERIRRCTFYKDVDLWSFYKATCPNVRTLGDTLNEGYMTTKDGPFIG